MLDFQRLLVFAEKGFIEQVSSGNNVVTKPVFPKDFVYLGVDGFDLLKYLIMLHLSGLLLHLVAFAQLVLKII